MSRDLQPVGIPTGHVFRIDRVRGPVWYAKYRLPDGRQVQKKLGPAWTERGRPPTGWFTTDLMGHGIGRRIHEPPNIPNYDAPGFGQPLTEGLVITIEPIIAAGHGAVQDAGDGWTITTQDGSYAAHFEHTIVITAGAPLLLTA